METERAALLEGLDHALDVAIFAMEGGGHVWASTRGARLAAEWGSVAELWRQLSTGPSPIELRGPRGRRVFEVREIQAGLFGVRDISALVDERENAQRARAELAAARDAALSASRAKSAFLANMSHELRTPLNAILGYGEMLLEEALDDGNASATADLQKILAAGRHLLALISDVLDLARIEAGRVTVQLTELRVADAVDEVAGAFVESAVAKGLRLETSVDASVGAVWTDGVKLKAVLRALVSNAVKFTESGLVRIEVSRVDEVLHLAVSDTGPGLEEEHRVRIFNDPYPSDTASARRNGGTGLGLQIAKRQIDMLGGKVAVDSALGRGATFAVEVPVRRPAPMDASELPVELQEAAGTGRPVLVIDDDPAVGTLIARYLAKEGLSVAVARDGAQGLELARRMQPALITLDVMMPGASGWQVLHEIKSTPDLADIPVIIVTMVDEEGTGLALGAADYLTKPLTRDRLVSAIRRHLRSPGPVLVVEDDASSRLLAERALAREGFEVHGAADGRAAIDWLSANVPALILLDLLLPEVDGFGVLAWLSQSEAHRDVPVLVATAMDPDGIDMSRMVGNVRSIVRKGGRTGEGVFGDVASLARSLARPAREEVEG